METKEVKKEETVQVFPWSYPEDPMKGEIMEAQARLLSHEVFNFLQTPPQNQVGNFEFNMDKFASIAINALNSDLKLSRMRFYLVPHK